MARLPTLPAAVTWNSSAYLHDPVYGGGVRFRKALSALSLLGEMKSLYQRARLLARSYKQWTGRLMVLFSDARRTTLQNQKAQIKTCPSLEQHASFQLLHCHRRLQQLQIRGSSAPPPLESVSVAAFSNPFLSQNLLQYVACLHPAAFHHMRTRGGLQ